MTAKLRVSVVSQYVPLRLHLFFAMATFATYHYNSFRLLLHSALHPQQGGLVGIVHAAHAHVLVHLRLHLALVIVSHLLLHFGLHSCCAQHIHLILGGHHRRALLIDLNSRVAPLAPVHRLFASVVIAVPLWLMGVIDGIGHSPVCCRQSQR